MIRLLPAVPWRSAIKTIAMLSALAIPLRAQDLSLTAPTATVAEGPAVNQATISWSYVRGALGYQVARREIVIRSDGRIEPDKWIQVAAAPGGPFVDVPPKPGTSYEYKVDAALRGGALSSSPPVRYNVPPYTTPQHVTVTGSADKTAVTWVQPFPVAGFHVWRQAVERDGMVLKPLQLTTAPISGTTSTFADVLPKLGIAYEYQIVSLTAAGATAPSAWVRYMAPPAPVVLTAPVVTIAGAGDRAILSWTSANPLAYYRVTRTTVDASGRAMGPPVDRRLSAPNALTLTDALSTPATGYAYVVTGFLPDMTASVTSATVVYMAPPFTTPGNIVAAGAGGQVGITWCAATGVAGYVVMRRTMQSDGSIADVSQRTTQMIPTPNYVDVVPKPGTIYEYQIVGIGMDGIKWPSAWVRYAAGNW